MNWTAQQGKAPVETPGSRPPCVLVVDDDRATRLSAEITLRLAGYKVVTADNTKLGLQLAADHSPDVVILDLQLATSDNLYVLQAVRALLFHKDIAVLATSNSWEKIFDLRWGHGRFGSERFDGWMLKPVVADVLLKEVACRL